MKTTPILGAAYLMVILLTSCGVSKSGFTVDYDKAVEDVRKSTVKNGIPRAKVYYHFRLAASKSLRLGSSGVHGGYRHSYERWDLQNGYWLARLKHTYVGRRLKVTPFNLGETCWDPKEKDYREPRLEPYFDTLYLMNAKNQQVGGIELPK